MESTHTDGAAVDVDDEPMIADKSKSKPSVDGISGRFSPADSSGRASWPTPSGCSAPVDSGAWSSTCLASHKDHQ